MSRENTLYVGGSGPGNYTKIQDAVDNASNGDTIFVYHHASPYQEHVLIDKSVTVLGEDTNTTMIDAGSSEYAISIQANDVTVEGFTILTKQYESQGVQIAYTNDTVISHNVFIHGYIGVCIFGAKRALIDHNLFSSETEGIFVWYNSSHTTISNNTLMNNTKGIRLYEMDNTNTRIIGNICEGNTDIGIGIEVGTTSVLWNSIKSNNVGISINPNVYDSEIRHNNMNENQVGLFVEQGKKSLIISQNNFINNTLGLNSSDSDAVTITQNNFIGNTWQAFFRGFWYQPNRWSGNYWSDFHGKGVKVIFGNVVLFAIPFGGYYHYFLVFRSPWVNFDWHPAQEPYNITGMS